MQGTVVMLLALSGLGCHHKTCAPAYVETCYSTCYTDGCYSSCYSGVGCYSSCYSAAYAPADFSCYSAGGYSPRHKHGLFGCKRSSCAACYEPPCPTPIYDPCGYGYGGGHGYHKNFGAFDYGVLPVYGTYTPVYNGYGSPGPVVGPTPSSSTTPMAPPGTPVPKPGDTAAPTTPDAPSPGNPAPTPAPPEPTTPAPTIPTPPVPPPAATTPPTPPPPGN